MSALLPYVITGSFGHVSAEVLEARRALQLRQGHVWHWPDVEAWARATGRLD